MEPTLPCSQKPIIKQTAKFFPSLHIYIWPLHTNKISSLILHQTLKPTYFGLVSPTTRSFISLRRRSLVRCFSSSPTEVRFETLPRAELAEGYDRGLEM